MPSGRPESNLGSPLQPAGVLGSERHIGHIGHRKSKFDYSADICPPPPPPKGGGDAEGGVEARVVWSKCRRNKHELYRFHRAGSRLIGGEVPSHIGVVR